MINLEEKIGERYRELQKGEKRLLDFQKELLEHQDLKKWLNSKKLSFLEIQKKVEKEEINQE